MPLDLHVLGLPLAFILSQDQTLHCIKCFVKSLAQISKVLFEITLFQEWKTLAAQSLQRTLFVYRYMNISLFLRGSDRFFQPSFAPRLTAVFSAESGAKINTFFETSKSFFQDFFFDSKTSRTLSLASRSSLTSLRAAKVTTFSESSKSFRKILSKRLRTSSLRSKSRGCNRRLSLKAGAKINTFSRPLQIFSTLFLPLFLPKSQTPLSVRQLLMKFF